MITITDEPYDGPIAVALVQALLLDLNERYADIDEADDPDDDDYLAEVTASMVQAPLGTFLVAWLDGEPAGCGALKPLDSDPAVGEIKRMYTSPRARRRGVSRALLARLEEVAAALGYRRVQLETGEAQPEAMALYESHGWFRITPYGHYKHSPQSVCFAKELDPAVRTGRHAVLVGATAAGKSSLALTLARQDPTWELLSVDSMQVYRGMDIGTAKPTPAERAEVPHHLLDLLDPWEDGTVAWFQREAQQVIADIEARGRRALLVGGTALYVQAIVDDLDIPGQYPDVRLELEDDPDTPGLYARLVELDAIAAARMDPGNRRRVVRALEVTLGSGRPFSSFGPGLDVHPPTSFAMVGVRRDPADLRVRIEDRYAAQLEAGFLDEVRRLFADPRGVSRTAGQALGYKELHEHVGGSMSLDEAVDLAVRRTARFARRQSAWFRRDPRITWLDASPGHDGNLLVDDLARTVG